MELGKTRPHKFKPLDAEMNSWCVAYIQKLNWLNFIPTAVLKGFILELDPFWDSPLCLGILSRADSFQSIKATDMFWPGMFSFRTRDEQNNSVHAAALLHCVTGAWLNEQKSKLWCEVLGLNTSLTVLTFLGVRAMEDKAYLQWARKYK